MMNNVSVVSYLNTAPFVYGLKKADYRNRNWGYSLDIPAVCAEKLMNGESVIGLVPVAVLAGLPHYFIVSDTCIGAVGEVDSVVLLHEVPLQEIKQVVLDYQSRTSVQLCRLLFKDYWNQDVDFLPSKGDVHAHVHGNTAAVLIGDRVFEHAHKFRFATDLSEAWNTWTGLPFVFAVWASLKKMDDSFIADFNEVISLGFSHLEEVISDAVKTYPAHYPVENYLRNRISYTLDASARQGMETFLSKLGKLNSA
jgi:chorismate dehydratase